MNKEVMKQALELALKAIDAAHEESKDPELRYGYEQAMRVIREALAQTVQLERKWAWLTKEDIELWGLPSLPTVYEFTKFIEAKLKEKNNEQV